MNTTSTYQRGAFRGRQRGAATLVISGVLLFIITLVSIITAGTVVVENQVTANQQREMQAFNSAQAGVDYVVALVETNLAGLTAGFVAGTDLPLTTGQSGQDLIPADVTNPAGCNGNHGVWLTAVGPGGYFGVRSQGLSDDCVGNRTVWQRVARGTSESGAPGDVPLVARGSAFGQSAAHKIVNPESNLTIWTGGEYDPNNSSTWISDPEDPCQSADPAYQIKDCGTNQADPNQGDTIEDKGLSVIANDTNLETLTDDQLLGLMFADPDADPTLGGDWQNFDDQAFLDRYPATQELSYEEFEGEAGDPISGIPGVPFWVGDGTGTLDFSGGTTVGCTEGVGPSEECGRAGHQGQERPVILVVDGDLSLGSNTVLYGLVYVRGNVDANGTPRIYGSLVLEGEFTGSGNVELYFSSTTLGLLDVDIARATVVPGSWRDFPLPP